ncbi:MAG: hypothetical protein J6T22_01895 [Bacteroidales bacterium]|nr:hypothetical protein [Bacteroidales bacterium]
MKKRLLQTGSLLMAFVVLFVSVGWDVKFHYCTEDHHMSGSFSDAAATCMHCLGHHHDHEETEAIQPFDVVQFKAKCCCEDFDSKIQFTDNFVFSPDKHLIVSLQSFVLPHLDLKELCAQVCTVFNNHSQRKTLKFLSGQERIVFFSSLKLNPLVF